jgi:predicted nucleic acid binding AN1-type Zn finger protein
LWGSLSVWSSCGKGSRKQVMFISACSFCNSRVGCLAFLWSAHACIYEHIWSKYVCM